MPLVTRKQYARVMTENIDGMHDIGFYISVPASTPLTVHETFTVPAGYVAVLRNATGSVAATAGASQANVLMRMTRSGQPTLDVFRVASDAGLSSESKVVSTAYNIIMPEGSVVDACYSNFDGSARSVRLYLVIDLIRL